MPPGTLGRGSESRLFSIRNVVGFGMGPKYINGRADPDFMVGGEHGRSVQVYVTRKTRTRNQERTLEADGQLVPSRVEDITTDVIEVGRPAELPSPFNAYTDPYPYRDVRLRPMAGGTAISPGMGTGTQSPGVVHESGLVGVLTNEHVGRLAEDDEVFYYPNPWAEDRLRLGRTHIKTTPEPGIENVNHADVRFIEAEDPDELTNLVLGLGVLERFEEVGPDAEGEFHTKSGFRSNLTSAELMSTDAEVVIDSRIGTLRYDGVHMYSPSALAGDSGSWFYREIEDEDDDDGFSRLAASSLLFAGSTQATWSVPESAAFEAIGECVPYDRGPVPDAVTMPSGDVDWSAVLGDSFNQRVRPNRPTRRQQRQGRGLSRLLDLLRGFMP